MLDWKSLNPQVIAEFRANGGKVARFGDLPLVILHTIGARSGKLLEIPLIVVLDGDELLLFGTAAGSSLHPGWVFNLRNQPRITVEYGPETFLADVRELPEAEAHRKRDAQLQSSAQFAAYAKAAAPRVIPVFSITRA